MRMRTDSSGLQRRMRLVAGRMKIKLIPLECARLQNILAWNIGCMTGKRRQ